jgi:hypothetical protein
MLRDHMVTAGTLGLLLLLPVRNRYSIRNPVAASFKTIVILEAGEVLRDEFVGL